MEDEQAFEHIPVLRQEVVRSMSPALFSGVVAVDCTIGGGGHAEALLEAVDGLVVVGIDRDQDALDAAARRLGGFGGRIRLAKANFAHLAAVMNEMAPEQVEQAAGVLYGVFYDLGVSSAQLDRPERGFRYRVLEQGPAPLDMRMDRSDPLSAADVVNTYPAPDLIRIIRTYGEERFARRIVRAIVKRRDGRPFNRADDLAKVVTDAIPAPTRRTGPHPARRTFQALRIEVNQELASLEASLPAAIQMLAPGGRVAAISYHSLEDRIVKRAFAEAASGCICPPDIPICRCGRRPLLRILTRRPVTPSPAEIRANPRSDSARLRVAERLPSEEAA